MPVWIFNFKMAVGIKYFYLEISVGGIGCAEIIETIYGYLA